MYGDTAVGRKRVAQLREQAGDIRALAASLVSQAEAVPWHGKAADTMRERIKERATHLNVAAAQHETAAESLAKHLGEVDTLKEAIEQRTHKATTLIEDARTRLGQAEVDQTEDDQAEHEQTEHEAPTHPADADDNDAALLAFTPPPAGHRDWLTVTLPGL